MRSSSNVSSVLVNLYTNYNIDTAAPRNITLTVEGGVWDDSLWDDLIWSASNAKVQRFRVGLAGQSLLIRVRNYLPNADLTLLKFLVTAESLSEKLG